MHRYSYFIENKKETMNIIHIENSSNKGITTNPENGEPEINLTVQGFYPSISTKTFLTQGKIILIFVVSTTPFLFIFSQITSVIIILLPNCCSG